MIPRVDCLFGLLFLAGYFRREGGGGKKGGVDLLLTLRRSDPCVPPKGKEKEGGRAAFNWMITARIGVSA